MLTYDNFGRQIYVPDNMTSNNNQTSLLKVNGLEGAKQYQMNPNSEAALFDGTDNIFFIKRTDGSNFPSIKAYRYEEIEIEKETKYVTMKDFENFKEELMNNVMQCVSGQPDKQSKQRTTDK